MTLSLNSYHSHSQIEQFIESIYPTQDPKALSVIHGADELDVDAQRKKAEDSQTSWEVFYLLAAVVGTLMFVGGCMVCSIQHTWKKKQCSLIFADIRGVDGRSKI